MNIVPKPKIISHKTLEIRINQEQIIDASKRLQKALLIREPNSLNKNFIIE